MKRVKKYQRSWRKRKKPEDVKSQRRFKAGPKLSKWQNTDRYYDYFLELNAYRLEEGWNDFLKTVKNLKRDLQKKVKRNLKNEKLILDNLVEYINIVTQFYDNGFPNCCPLDKKDALISFYQEIRSVVRRQDVVISYKNTSKPGERVTSTNLLVGDAKIITEEQIKYFPLIQKIDEKIYAITVIMRPISLWRQGQVCDINYKRAVIKYDLFQKIVENSSKILIEECDALLS